MAKKIILKNWLIRFLISLRILSFVFNKTKKMLSLPPTAQHALLEDLQPFRPHGPPPCSRPGVLVAPHHQRVPLLRFGTPHNLSPSPSSPIPRLPRTPQLRKKKRQKNPKKPAVLLCCLASVCHYIGRKEGENGKKKTEHTVNVLTYGHTSS